MPPKPELTLRDKELLADVANGIRKLPFLSKTTRNLLKEARGKVDAEHRPQKETRGLAGLPEKDITQLWRELLVDAIHFLKICDGRERACWETDRRSGKKIKRHLSKIDEEKRHLNVFGVSDIHKFFTQFTEFEAVLYGADSGYRDHIVHPLRVWLIGARILLDNVDKLDLGAGNLVKLVPTRYPNPPQGEEAGTPPPQSGRGRESGSSRRSKPVPLPISRGEVWAMWTVVALCHDLGYPLEKSEKVNDVLEEMLVLFGRPSVQRFQFNFQIQHGQLADLLLAFLGSKLKSVNDEQDGARFRTVRQAKYTAKFAHSWENFNHGMVGCLILLRTLSYFLETDYCLDPETTLADEDARQFQIRREILRSIAVHTTAKVYHVAVNTLPFLLVLSDELQEWGRPTMADMKKGSIGAGASKVTAYVDLTPACSKVEGTILYGADSVDVESLKRNVTKKFRRLHELLRPAVDDAKRSFSFRWTISRQKDRFQLRFDSGAQPLQELSTKEGRKLFPIYGPKAVDGK